MKLYYGVVYVQYSAQTLACFMYSTVTGSYRWFKPGFNEIMPAQSKIPAAPWELPTFQRSPTAKKDYWNVMEDWVVRMHCHSRAQPFQPLHSTFPLHRDAGEHIDSQRVTVAFFEGMDTHGFSGFMDTCTNPRNSGTLEEQRQVDRFHIFPPCVWYQCGRAEQGQQAWGNRWGGNWQQSWCCRSCCWMFFSHDGGQRLCSWRCQREGQGMFRPWRWARARW